MIMIYGLRRGMSRGVTWAIPALLALSLAAQAGPVNGTLFYSTYYNSGVSQKPGGVDAISFNYNGAGVLSLGTSRNLVTFASGVVSDGIVFTGDGYLAVGGGNVVHKVDPNRVNTFTDVSAGNTSAFHMMVSPDGTIYSSGIPGTPASYAPTLVGGGIAHPLSGDDLSIDTIAWSDARHAFYTSSGAGGNGDFGILNLTTFRTTRLFTNLPAAHGMVFDSYTGNLMLFGAHHVTQIDPNTGGMVSDLDLSSSPVPLGLDQGTSDGLGHLFVASNTGYMVFLDITNSRRVGAADFMATPFIGPQVDDFAPLIGPGAPVPEPGSIILLATGVLSIFGLGWRRRGGA